MRILYPKIKYAYYTYFIPNNKKTRIIRIVCPKIKYAYYAHFIPKNKIRVDSFVRKNTLAVVSSSNIFLWFLLGL